MSILRRSAAAAVCAAALLSGTTVHALAAPVSPAATPEPVRVLAWNIWHGGQDPAVGGAANLPRVVDQLVAISPDVFFAVETYGAADAIREGLTARAGKGAYSATRITSSSSDNLWIFTRYPVVKVYPKPSGSAVTDFNFGGVRVALPNGRQLNLFDTWLSYTNPWIGDMIDTNATDAVAGRRATYAARKVAGAESRAQTPQLTDIVRNQLPLMLAGDTSPVVLAGDFNTVPAADWAPAWSRCARHYGLGYELRTTTVLTETGFTDTYRAANPDVCTHPGRTWSPQPEYGYMITDDRIDFVFTRGAGVTVTASTTVDSRLPEHGPGRFYSDHAAVVTDLLVS
ncbi:endonuclease/exonuclease/phosphatase family protein [Longispora albida]|uniref:endonuclease/exonuclease/phosphatase family protein n=1 Tax=Longispora albida TaxID=203523 RepID=UPI0003725534|nr:endonuclease/exonuclease/phosphatase family protein [Longispora albida]